jgi:nitronate monooxygenase
MDGAGIRSLLQLGAEGVQLGTAFLLCPESATDAGYRQALSAEPPPQTVMTAAISGRPARSIDNAFCEIGRRHPGCCLPTTRWPTTRESAGGRGESAGRVGIWGAMGRRGVAMIRALPAADLMQALIREGGFCTQQPRRDGDLPRLPMSDRADV